MNPTDAHLLKGLLESEGIEAVVQGEFLWIARGEVPITTDTALLCGSQMMQILKGQWTL
jgi:hypothetical protein